MRYSVTDKHYLICLIFRLVQTMKQKDTSCVVRHNGAYFHLSAALCLFNSLADLSMFRHPVKLGLHYKMPKMTILFCQDPMEHSQLKFSYT